MSFDGVPATAVVVNGTTIISATTPAYKQGGVKVVVTNPDGQSARLAGSFVSQKLMGRRDRPRMKRPPRRRS